MGFSPKSLWAKAQELSLSFTPDINVGAIILFFILHSSFLFSQTPKIDSLENVLKTLSSSSPSGRSGGAADTTKINTLNALSRELTNQGDYEKAMQYANDAVNIISSKFKVQGLKLEEIKNLKLETDFKLQTLNFKLFSSLATAYNNIGNIYNNQDNYDKALENYFAALKLVPSGSEKTPEWGRITTNLYNNIGIIHYNKGDYGKALELYFKTVKINEEIGNKNGLASVYNNIGLIQWKLGNYSEALKSYNTALKINEELGNKKFIAYNYINIGIIYYSQGNYSEALKNYLAALKTGEESGNKNIMSYSYNAIGGIYQEQNDYSEALKSYLAALKIREEIGDKNEMAGSYINVGLVNTKLKKFAEAEKCLNRSLELSKEIGNKEWMKLAYQELSRLDSIQNNWKGAYKYHKLYSLYKDSIFNKESSKQIAEMQTKYETEKKEQQIKLLNKDKEIQTKDLERQKTIRNAVAGGLIMVLLFSFVLINRLLLIRKQKKVIEIEREKSEKLLLNILPKEIAEELKAATNRATASSGGTVMPVQPKKYEMVTVMFTDFKGFTTIAEKMSAEELVSELNFIFKKFDEIISKYPIEKIKTIGDAYMCAGGLPTPNESNPMDVVLAALEIQEWMEKLAVGNLQLANEGKETPKLQTANWKLRIGIHTGSVIAGVVGDKKFAYDIWGDTVNTASRMESSGEAGKVNISGSTYKLLVGATESVALTESPLQFQFRGKIPAKNKGEIEMYFVEKK